jgi:hypothetical protein
MWSAHALRNFENYVKTTPKHLWGTVPSEHPPGGYDGARGSRDHIASRRLEQRDFSAGGRLDFRGAMDAEGGENKAVEFIAHLARSMDADSWAELGVLLRGEAGEEADDELPSYTNGLPKNAAAIAAEDALIATLGGVRDAGGRPIATSARAVRQHALDVASRVVLGA